MLRSLEAIGQTVGLTDESVCPTLPSKDFHPCGAGGPRGRPARQSISSRLLTRRQFAITAAAAAAAPAPAAAPSLAIARAKVLAPPEGIAEEARRLARAAVDSLGGMGRFVSRGCVVWVKPNIGWDRRPEQAACSCPDVVAAIVQMCYQAGAGKVIVGDNPCAPAERSYMRSGIRAAAEKAGAQCPYMDDRKFRKMAIRGGRAIREWEVYTGIVEADRLINVAIAKQHSLCAATLGMKNLMGAIGGDRNRFHQNIGVALADLAGFLRPQLVVLDAVRILAANGPTGGNLSDVRRKGTIAAGVDQVAVDAFGATLLGLAPGDVPYIAEGNARGLGTMNFESLAPIRVEI